VIVSLHVATGAAIGAATGSHAAAVPLGLLAHFLGDVMPHQDLPNRSFEINSGAALVGLLIVRRGLGDPAVVGALAASLPDVEHVYRLPRPGGRKLFPTHRWRRLHQGGGVRAWMQLLAAGFLFGAVLASPAQPRAARDQA
jgi:hypothetical protein